MDIASFLERLESSNLGTSIRDSLYLFPFIESLHVVGLAVVFGMIVILDLRLLGIASVNRPVIKVKADIMKWTWMAFVLTATTGVLMFITNASGYYGNFFFRTKMVLLGLAGANMLLFELTSGRVIHRWDQQAAASKGGKTAAILSLVLWITIIFMGRWIGFTISRTEAPAAGPEVNFDDLFTPPPEENTPPK
jgi:hypothetical protein